jgi:FkbM family methyltransferase
MKIYDENNNLVDINNIEIVEQQQAKQYIKPDDIVLELGARYGSVSCIVNNILNNKYNQVVVEPDNRVWDCLEYNKNINNCYFKIIKGFISNKNLKLNYPACKYSTFSSEGDSNIPSYKLKDITDLKFNVLIADCEGFMETFINENLDLLDNLRLIMFEKDNPDICNYKNVEKILLNNNFKCIDNSFHSIFMKNQF